MTILFAVAGFVTAFQMICLGGPAGAAEAPPRLNVLFITADDMNYDTPGFTGNRVPEELYDFAADPAALHNLIAAPARRAQLGQMRQAMVKWMEETKDPLLPKYRAVLE